MFYSCAIKGGVLELEKYGGVLELEKYGWSGRAHLTFSAPAHSGSTKLRYFVF